MAATCKWRKEKEGYSLYGYTDRLMERIEYDPELDHDRQTSSFSRSMDKLRSEPTRAGTDYDSAVIEWIVNYGEFTLTGDMVDEIFQCKPQKRLSVLQYAKARLADRGYEIDHVKLSDEYRLRRVYEI